MIRKIIHTANEQYHFNRAISDFGHNAVVEARTEQLGNQSPGANPLMLGIQARCEVILLEEIAKGGTPFGDVHRALQRGSNAGVQDNRQGGDPEPAIV